MPLDARSPRTVHAAGARWTLGGILLLAMVLRVPGLFTDLWLDEVWSLSAVEPMRSWLDVFTAFKSDNNHHLNSLWLYLAGPAAPQWHYRLVALVAGVASVVFAWLLGRRDSLQAAVLAALVVAASFPLTLYSSEARGYAAVVAAALGAWYFLQHYADQPNWGRAWPIWVCALLGLLSHLSMVYTLVGGGVWLTVHFNAETSRMTRVTRVLAQALGVPLVVALALARFVLRGSVLGGGPPYSLPSLLAETLASAVGVVGSSVLAGAVGFVVAGLFLEALWYQAREHDDRWVFYAVTVVAAPAFLLLAARPPFLFVRYFATQVAFVMVVLGATWAGRWRACGAPRLVACSLVVAYLGSSGLAIVRLWALGRGHYREALTHVCADVEHRPIRVASDHDFRNGMMVRYYARHGRPGCDITYATRADVLRQRADWFVSHDVGAASEPSAELTDAGGNKYSFVRSYPAHELSGMTWHVYRASPALTGR